MGRLLRGVGRERAASERELERERRSARKGGRSVEREREREREIERGVNSLYIIAAQYYI